MHLDCPDAAFPKCTPGMLNTPVRLFRASEVTLIVCVCITIAPSTRNSAQRIVFMQC